MDVAAGRPGRERLRGGRRHPARLDDRLELDAATSGSATSSRRSRPTAGCCIAVARTTAALDVDGAYWTTEGDHWFWRAKGTFVGTTEARALRDPRTGAVVRRVKHYIDDYAGEPFTWTPALVIVERVADLLLVDDDPPIRRMLERTLTAEGYSVEAAADGGAALAAIERNVPDAIVLDVSMPGIDGLAVTRRVRAKGLRVPILLLTARDAVHERVAGLDAGADDYLVKPFDPDELSAPRPRAAAPQRAGDRGRDARVRRPRAGGRRSPAAAAATSSSRPARPSCSSCCCATPAAS